MNQRRATISLFNSFLRIRYPLRPSTTTLTSPLPFVTNSTSKPQSIRTIAPMVWQNPRSYSGGSCNDLDHNKEVDAINLKFAEAREEIETALESKETVYFDEEAECARAAVKEVLGMFDGLLARLSEKEKGALQRSMGLKIEQLKAELKQLDE
ncbi:embryogenesis-like protein [Arachis stenosperma]|uniref:embryogenesis-like protein n=1 Tax=Arachis stenosperma TaxID=217475 RepID=UPI0025ACB9AA|nr:embryogenesis-like protein [Arachis stenosperma]